MPRINDLIIKSVFFIYMSTEDAVHGYSDSASGFFVGIPGEKLDKQFFIYAVTNRHVIDHENMESPILRVNSTDGKFKIIETTREKWRKDPLGSDIAIYEFDVIDGVDCFFLQPDFFLTREFIQNKNVGVGDDVFMIGNFQSRGGKVKNLPVVRFGNISQMPNEPMINPHTKMDEESFVVEMRSISGFSGSPVILSIPWIFSRQKENNALEGKERVPKWTPPRTGLL